MAREAARPSRQVRRAQARRKQQKSPKTFRFERFVALLLLTAGVFAYHNALHGPFVMDDLYAISRNVTIRALWPLWRVLSPPPHSAATGRPVVNLSLALNYAFHGLDVTSYHVFNLGIHILAALVIVGIVRRTLRASEPEARSGEATGIATAAALLWVVHPLTSESVVYTIQRTELLMGLFFLLTLYCALRWFESPEHRFWYAAALTAFAVGIGSKEVIVVAPLVVIAYDWLFCSVSLRDALKRHWRLYAGFAAVLLLFILFVATRFRRVFAGLRGRAITPWDYAITQSGVIVHYLRLSLWPHPLVADYGGWPIATSVTSVLPFLVVVVTLIALTLWGLARRQKLAFLGIWFFIILAPTSSFRPMPSEVAAERRMYLPLIAVVVLLVLGGRALLHRWGASRAAGMTLLVGVAATLAFVTVRRNDDYRTTLAFWSDIVAKRPNNARAHVALGRYLHEHGRRSDALEQMAEAVRLEPNNGNAQYGLGLVLGSQGKTDEAIEHYREAVRINPENASAHNNLGVALASRSKIDEAIEHYREAIRIEPDQPQAHYNLALQLARRGRTGEATEHLEAVVRLKPDYPNARRALDDLRSRASP